MDISNMTNEQILAVVDTADKESLRYMCNELEVTFSGNTGEDKLREKIKEAVAERDEPEVDAAAAALAAVIAEKEDEEEPEVVQSTPKSKESLAELLEGDPAKEPDVRKRRRMVKAQALRLIRVQVQNLDPADSQVPGALVTCYSKYTGKVAHYVPFGEENEHGWHLPKIIVDDLKTRTYNIRKEIKKSGNAGGVKQYKNVAVKKFAITEMEPLTKAQIADLAREQAAKGSVQSG